MHYVKGSKMIDFRSVSFSYGRKSIFSGLDLRLKSGGICGLLGKNGTGKTTLLNLISGLLFPDTGTCATAGFIPEERKPDFLAQICTVGENIPVSDLKTDDYLRRYAPFYPEFSKERMDEYLEKFEVRGVDKIQSMSLGNRKKFFLAFAFSANARVLLLDEPTNGLDIPSKSIFRKILMETADEEKLIIISTHQVRDLENIIDPVLILESGEIIFNYSITEIQEKLFFSVSRDEVPGSLYSEKIPGGWANVSESPSRNDESKNIDIQLELLFGAILKNREKVERIFRKEEVSK